MSSNINLGQYVGKTFECACGKLHSTTLERIDLEEGSMGRIAGFIKEKGYKKVYVVTDKNIWKICGKDICQNLKGEGVAIKSYVLQYDELIPDEKPNGEIYLNMPLDADFVLAIGSGTLNDMCKLLSYRMGTEYMVFATAPSMDGFASTGAAMIVNHVKVSYETHGPIAIFAEPEILAQAPMDMITAGLADILGKYTCLLDWKLAHMVTGEYYCEYVADLVKNAIEVVREQSVKIKERDPEAAKSVTEALILSGIAMFYVGNSRPASGSEHHMSHYWEMQYLMQNRKAILHGTKVGINTISSIYLYRSLLTEEVDFAKATEAAFDYEAWKERVIRCYEDAAPGIIALDDSCDKNHIDTRNARIHSYEANWDQIKAMIDEALPSVQAMEDLLAGLDAPINPSQIGVDKQMCKDGIVLAKEVRNRYTVLQMLWDLGLLEDYSAKLADYYFG